jgi:glyoxylase-like metal-dependent hydrolase (beta-lactamase superfamily II)
MVTVTARPQEVAPGVYRVEAGPVLAKANVYLIRSGSAWALIDAGWSRSGPVIRAAAQSLFGPGARPAAILLTHTHPDHAGSALELARLWERPVSLHPDEMPLAPGGLVPAYANPLDRWLVAPLLKLVPRRKLEAMQAEGSLEPVASAFDPATGVPGLPDWECLPTPGHTPGHVAFFRSRDRVLVTGDAVLTISLNPLHYLPTNKQRVFGPPHISTWDWPAAKRSAAALADLEPHVLATGHGRPLTGAGTADLLRSFAESL